MQLSPQNRQQLGQLYRALADKVLMPGDVNYLPALHQQGGVDVMAELATEIEFQDGGSVGVFTGQRGTGKSTELRRLEAMLKDAGCSVVCVDMSEYMFMYKPVEVSDFLVSLCGAFSDAIEKLCGGWGPGQTGYWERFQNFLNSKVELKELGASLSGVDIKATLRTDLLFKQRLQDGARSHVVQLIQDAHAFFADAVKQLRIQQGDLQRKVVLIVDSVERLRGDGSEANEMAVYESVRTLFFGHAESLRLPELHVVYTVPPYMSVLAAGPGLLMGGAVTRRIYTTHIFKDRTREEDPAGLALMRQVVALRHPDWSQLIQADALNRLAVSSGGDLREFFRLIRYCLPTVRDDSQLPLSKQAVAVAENQARTEMLPIPDEYLSWLQRISKSHAAELAVESHLPTLARFLDGRLVLIYRNGDDWYDIHPLLRGIVDAHVPSAADA